MLRGDGLAGVPHREDRPLLPAGEVHVHPSRFPGVFHRVVQQDHHQPFQAVRLPREGEIGLDVAVQLHLPLKGHRLEAQHAPGDQVAEVDCAGILGPLRPVVLGQKEHVLHQLLHPLGLLLDVAQPLALGGHRGVRVGGHDPGVGQNHREGGLQLVGGVGHKLPLLGPGPFHRLQGQPGQKQADGEEHRQSRPADEQRVEHQPSQGGPLPAEVGEGDAHPAVGELLLLEPQTKILQGAGGGLGVPDRLDRLGQGLLCDLDLAALLQGDGSVFLNGDTEYRDGPTPLPRPALVGQMQFQLGRDAVLAQGQLHGGGALPLQLLSRGNHQRPEHRQQHHRHQQHIGEDKFQPQPAQHAALPLFRWNDYF